MLPFHNECIAILIQYSWNTQYMLPSNYSAIISSTGMRCHNIQSSISIYQLSRNSNLVFPVPGCDNYTKVTIHSKIGGFRLYRSGDLTMTQSVRTFILYLY